MRPPRIYVAGASKEPERVRRAMRAVESIGCVLTLDWLAVIEATGAANEGLCHDARMRFASDDLGGVDDADLVWILAPDNTSVGAWVEMGYALGRSKVMLVSGPAAARSIFCALAEEYATDEEVPARIQRIFRADLARCDRCNWPLATGPQSAGCRINDCSRRPLPEELPGLAPRGES